MDNFLIGAFFAFLLIFSLARSLDFLDSKNNLFEEFFSKKTLSTKFSYSALRSSLVLVLLTAFAGLIFTFLDKNPSASAFGDFLGGTLGSIFSFLSFGILIWSLHSQMRFQQESEDLQREQLNQALQQKHDEFFYLLLDRWRQSADLVAFRSPDGEEKIGRNALSLQWNRAEAFALDSCRDSFGYNIYDKSEEVMSLNDRTISSIRHYAALNTETLFSYFSIFCRLLDYVEKNMHKDREAYLKIARSYMHSQEIFLVYAMAASRAYNELNAISILNSSNFLAELELAMPRIVYISQLLTTHVAESGWFSDK